MDVTRSGGQLRNGGSSSFSLWLEDGLSVDVEYLSRSLSLSLSFERLNRLKRAFIVSLQGLARAYGTLGCLHADRWLRAGGLARLRRRGAQRVRERMGTGSEWTTVLRQSYFLPPPIHLPNSTQGLTFPISIYFSSLSISNKLSNSRIALFHFHSYCYFPLLTRLRSTYTTLFNVVREYRSARHSVTGNLRNLKLGLALPVPTPNTRRTYRARGVLF